MFWNDTSELFELNKIWVTYAVAIIIGGVWVVKMIYERQFKIQRTPLDIAILLFLLSQIISTLISWDRYISFWGYYARFNGGLLSTIVYIFLYYALVSNSKRKDVLWYVWAALGAGLLTALWGLPSHFGYDPTCLIFRGSLDVSCWTDAFQPKVRIFSTLGQPDWLAAHLDALLPISVALGMIQLYLKRYYLAFALFGLSVLFYIDILFTAARSGFLGFVIPFFLFLIIILWWYKREDKGFKKVNFWKRNSYLFVVISLLCILTFVIGTPIAELNKFTLSGIVSHFTSSHKIITTKATKNLLKSAGGGGTDSGAIRLFVWQGALDAWRHYPIFGTGVETFAFAYYQYRPPGHNMTSEWDYLYNKAHNEYLNYLTTTGLFGLGTYIIMIGLFLGLGLRKVPNAYYEMTTPVAYDKRGKVITYSQKQTIDDRLLILGIFTGYISILIVNFFGFSVVTVNEFLFLFPGFVWILENRLDRKKVLVLGSTVRTKSITLLPFQHALAFCSFLIVLFTLASLWRQWDADRAYGLGYNYDRAGYYQQATRYLEKAVDERNDEPVFLDELSLNYSILATAYAAQKNVTIAGNYAQKAITLSNMLTETYPHNVVFWKSAVRIFYSLGQYNQQYYTMALQAGLKAQQLAPTDAKIAYNVGLLQGQTGNLPDGIKTLKHTIILKSDYIDAYYALGLFYHLAALNGKTTIQNSDLEKKAVETMHYILTNFDSNNKQVKDSLSNWGEQ